MFLRPEERRGLSRSQSRARKTAPCREHSKVGPGRFLARGQDLPPSLRPQSFAPGGVTGTQRLHDLQRRRHRRSEWGTARPAGAASEPSSLKTVSPRAHAQPSPHLHYPVSVLLPRSPPTTLSSVLSVPLSPLSSSVLSHRAISVPSYPAFLPSPSALPETWPLPNESLILPHLSLKISLSLSHLQDTVQTPKHD